MSKFDKRDHCSVCLICPEKINKIVGECSFFLQDIVYNFKPNGEETVESRCIKEDYNKKVEICRIFDLSSDKMISEEARCSINRIHTYKDSVDKLMKEATGPKIPFPPPVNRRSEG